jgi:hypothetical protein
LISQLKKLDENSYFLSPFGVLDDILILPSLLSFFGGFCCDCGCVADAGAGEACGGGADCALLSPV